MSSKRGTVDAVSIHPFDAVVSRSRPPERRHAEVTPPTTIAGRRASRGAWYALAVLAVTTFVAMLDRQIMLLLAEPIRVDLNLSDLQLGLLQGTGVAFFAALAGFPLGWLADRFDRRIVLAGCVAFWSAAVMANGMAASFPGLLASSAMVGAGEAGLAPVMYALIPLLFFGSQRQVANSIAAMATVGGGALAFVAGGEIIAMVETVRPDLPVYLGALAEWRLAFFASALPAPIMIALILSIRTPKQRPRVTASVVEVASDRIDALAYFRGHAATLTLFYLGGAVGSFAFASLSVWSAIIAARLFGQSPLQIGSAMGLAQLASAGLGFVLSNLIARRWQDRIGARLPVRVMAVSLAFAALIATSLLLASSAAHLFVCYGLIGVALTVAAMVFPTALQSIAPSHLRGRAISIQFILAMVLASAGPPLVGLLSDRMAHSTKGPLPALVLVVVPALVVAVLLLASCERTGLQAALDDAARLDGEARAAAWPQD